MICDGCGEPGAECYLLFTAPLGLTGVHVHRRPECANTAKDRRGGGKWLPKEQQNDPFDLTQRRSAADERLLAAVTEEAARLKENRWRA